MLDRVAHRRKDRKWLADSMLAPTSKFILFSNLEPIVITRPDFSEKSQLDKFCLLAVRHEVIKGHLKLNPLVVLLGVEISTLGSNEEVIWFAVDISAVTDVTSLHPQAKVLAAYPGLMLLEEKEAAVVAQARSLIAWHDR